MKQLQNDLDTLTAKGPLVFPSEIAARFWRNVALGTHTAVREDLFLSWDTFKERAFELRGAAVPANRTVRTVFAQGIVRKNASRQVLRELIPPGFASSAGGFVRTIELVLPRIPAALTVLRGPHGGRLGRIRDDLEYLSGEYSAFLDQHGFFEPRWLQAARHFSGGRYTIVTPGIIDDYNEFAPALAHLPQFVPTPSTDSVLTIYRDARTEISELLSELATLLDAGSDPEHILVSCGDFERLADRLSHEAEKFNVPLIARAGRPLLQSAVGRFVQSLGDVVSSGFSAGAMERMLLNAAIPWKSRMEPHRLVTAGVRHGALGGASRPDPRWNLAVAAGARHTAPLFRSLERLVPAVCNATSFADLRQRFNRLLGTLIDRDGWNAVDEPVLERAQEELRQLAHFESQTGLKIENPYRFWTERLGEQQYVPQQEAGGIDLLPYRVGAATFPAHHFVVNATQESTAVVIRPFAFLNDAERAILGSEVSDRDMTRAFFDVYSVSGENVRFSASRETFEGTAIPAGYFLSAGPSAASGSGLPPASGPGRSATSDTGPAATPGPTPLQREGLEEYLRGLSLATPDITRAPVSDPWLIRYVRTQLEAPNAPGKIRLSPSHVDLFRACPYRYLLLMAFNVEEVPLAINPEDPAELGRLYHDILAGFFDELVGTPYRSADVEDLRKRLGAIADARFSASRGMIPDVVYASKRVLFDRIADALLAEDARLIDGHTPLFVEEWEQQTDAEGDYLLVGRVDRVTRDPDGQLALVDYKKSGLPSRGELHGGAAEPLEDRGSPEWSEARDRITTVQIPLYVRLLESEGEHVAAAGYYSLESGRYLPVVDERPIPGLKPVMSRQRLDQIIDDLGDIVDSMAERISRGDFSCNDCTGCSLRSVCRTRYHVP